MVHSVLLAMIAAYCMRDICPCLVDKPCMLLHPSVLGQSIGVWKILFWTVLVKYNHLLCLGTHLNML
jgi:hypothetical protein